MDPAIEPGAYYHLLATVPILGPQYQVVDGMHYDRIMFSVSFLLLSSCRLLVSTLCPAYHE